MLSSLFAWLVGALTTLFELTLVVIVFLISPDEVSSFLTLLWSLVEIFPMFFFMKLLFWDVGPQANDCLFAAKFGEVLAEVTVVSETWSIPWMSSFKHYGLLMACCYLFGEIRVVCELEWLSMNDEVVLKILLNFEEVSGLKGFLMKRVSSFSMTGFTIISVSNFEELLLLCFKLFSLFCTLTVAMASWLVRVKDCSVVLMLTSSTLACY